MKLIILFLFFFSFCSNSFAETILTGITIKKIRTYEKDAIVEFEPSIVNNENCREVEASKYSFHIDYAPTTHADNMHAIILSAFYLGKKIDVKVDGCSDWDYQLPRARRIDVGSNQ